ncbi:DNA polymerase III subunit beta [Novimethylophilus kurashikiensis]|uniref:DNA polymerase III subunit beta n=1 Tax=Novimethylophilus kurashikiensis TaxID=1825523 RepID=A0A2R5F9B4_9PROT|nr:DNA polymerase III subunit beta [Novimethylophilus kurashikiensis]
MTVRVQQTISMKLIKSRFNLASLWLLGCAVTTY